MYILYIYYIIFITGIYKILWGIYPKHCGTQISKLCQGSKVTYFRIINILLLTECDVAEYFDILDQSPTRIIGQLIFVYNSAPERYSTLIKSYSSIAYIYNDLSPSFHLPFYKM